MLFLRAQFCFIDSLRTLLDSLSHACIFTNIGMARRQHKHRRFNTLQDMQSRNLDDKDRSLLLYACLKRLMLFRPLKTGRTLRWVMLCSWGFDRYPSKRLGSIFISESYSVLLSFRQVLDMGLLALFYCTVY
jgi:hypothetical protein